MVLGFTLLGLAAEHFPKRGPCLGWAILKEPGFELYHGFIFNSKDMLAIRDS